MDSVKSIVVVAILLGVLYGIYQVVNDEDSPIAPTPNLLADFDSDSKEADSKEADSATGDSHSSGSSTSESDDLSSEFPNGASESRNKVPNTPQGYLTTQTDFNPEPKSSFEKSGESSPPKFVYPQRDNRSDLVESGNPTGTFSASGSGENESGKGSRAVLQDATTVNNRSRSDNVQTNAIFDAPNLRDRFIKGSYADFTKQVASDMRHAETLIRQDDFIGALRLLSRFYDDPRLTREENTNLLSWLDPLAGKVVYSMEHHITQPYYVRRDDTLNLISAKFGVPPELILNINRARIPNPNQLVAGTELKLFNGPFHVEISVSKKRLTLFLRDIYAGTFPVRIGAEPVPKIGKYRVLSKSRLGQDYTDRNSQTIPAGDPNNPYGSFYLNIGGDLAIHGSAKQSDSNDRRGCISLNAVDAQDIHNILTTESTVLIVE